MRPYMQLAWATSARTMIGYVILVAIAANADDVVFTLVSGLLLLGWVLLPAVRKEVKA